ncbi:hypothetical protein V5S96_09045 [Corynebacterium mastitidis]|uniref:Secreted protein n=1 Tax=Corynebacterium mastitidis TaxID=161890 RepID=A0ABU8NZQ2_9CORY
MALVLGVSNVAVASPGTGEEVDITPNSGSGEELDITLKISDTWGNGWCIDLGFPNPSAHPELFKDGEVAPRKLTHVAKPQEVWGASEEIPFAGQQRDAAINLLKRLKKAYDAGDYEDARAYNVALQLVLTSSMNKAESGLTFLKPNVMDKVKSYLLEHGGYRLTQNERGQDIVKPVEGASIPKAADSEYITVIAPSNYDITKGATNSTQRIVPIDQPGLDDEPKKPESSEVPVPEETTSATERPAPRKPVIGTSAAFADGAKQVVAGATCE